MLVDAPRICRFCGSAFRWAADKVLTVLFGPEEECPDYPATVKVECPCGCGMTMGEIKWVVE